MNIVVDTSVWSLLLRREKRNEEDPYVRLLRRYLQQEEGMFLVGPVLLELLDGVRNQRQFDLLLEYLEPFPLIQCDRSLYIEAARLKNSCRSKGIQASSIDFLIASACIQNNHFLLSADRDFVHIARHYPLNLLKP